MLLQRRGMRWPTLFGDVGLSLLVTVSIAVVSIQIEPESGERPIDSLAYGVIAVAGGALALRRCSPLVVVLTVTAAMSVYLARDYVGGPVFVTGLLALYMLATTGNRRLAVTATVGTAGLLVLVGTAAGTGSSVVHLVFIGWAAAAVLLGDAVHGRRQHVATLEEWARHLEQTREAEAQRRVSEERLRIARDLHDSVAHSMAAINVQAGVAAHVMDRRPDQAQKALVVIKEASRDVLEGMAALLGLMRDHDHAQERTPLPGLGRIEDLVASTRQAGRQVTVRLEPPANVPAPIAVAAYRIVQESLTNILRHAGPDSSATVAVGDAGDGGLVIEITDDGRTPPDPGAGRGMGLKGMQERAEASGGTFAAGPDPGGGFAVRARWPAP